MSSVMVSCAPQFFLRPDGGDNQTNPDSERNLQEPVNAREPGCLRSRNQQDDGQRDARESIGALVERENGANQPEARRSPRRIR